MKCKYCKDTGFVDLATSVKPCLDCGVDDKNKAPLKIEYEEKQQEFRELMRYFFGDMVTDMDGNSVAPCDTIEYCGTKYFVLGFDFSTEVGAQKPHVYCTLVAGENNVIPEGKTHGRIPLEHAKKCV